MKLTTRIRLLPSPEQHAALLATMERTNAACNAISDAAWGKRLFGQYALHREVYQRTRADFGLTAQMVVRSIAKVADAYKTTGNGGMDREARRTFRPHGAIAYDDRILRYFTERQVVSIWTISGRLTVRFVVGDHALRLLVARQGESDLVYHRGAFYLLATCNAMEPDLETMDDVLGVDFGITRLATDSDGESYSGQQVNQARQWYETRRAALQSVGTKSAKRRLQQLSGRQRRFQRDVNHCISKRLVEKAKGTKRAIALEDLSGIRKRTTVRKSQRSRHSNWAFAQLRQFVTYKATLKGVPVVLVDPAYTSRTCHACGHQERANRKSQAGFVCQACGHTANADFNAALNIAERSFGAARGVLNRPMVSAPFHPTAVGWAA